MQLPKPASSMISVIYFWVTARHDIILHCFSYDFCMGYLHQNKLLCKVFIIVYLSTTIYCHVMWEVYVVKFNLASSALHICIFSMSFCVYISKAQFCTNLYCLYKWHKTEVHVWCDVSCNFSYCFFRAENCIL